jgi:hypothetical protein
VDWKEIFIIYLGEELLTEVNKEIHKLQGKVDELR